MIRVPVVDDDTANVGYLFKLVLKALPPGQKKIYVFRAGENQIIKWMGRGMDCFLSDKQVMGVHSIANLFPTLCKMSGIADWQKKTPHLMRSFVATRLANDPNVNRTEVARSLRHNSVHSQNAYVIPTSESEARRAESLGIAIPDCDKKMPAKKKSKKRGATFHNPSMSAAAGFYKKSRKQNMTTAALAQQAAMSGAPMYPPYGNPFVPSMAYPGGALPWQPPALHPPFAQAFGGGNPFAPPPSHDPSFLASIGLTPEQIQAILDVDESTDDEE